MSHEAVFVLVLTGVAAAMMASNRVRYDFVALTVVIALIVSGVLSTGQALSGFGSSVVVMVACLLVVGEMLDRTGVARAVGSFILERGGGNEIRLLVLLMVAAAVLGSAMSSTAVVAIFIPIIARIAADTGIARSKLLLPMSYAALISGMLTLIATPPNLVVSDGLVDDGYEPLGFFSFLPIGIVILVLAIVYCVFVARPLLARAGADPAGAGAGRDHSIAGLNRRYGITGRMHVVTVEASSPAIEDLAGCRILARRRPRPGQGLVPVAFAPGMELRAGDQLLVLADPAAIASLTARPDFSLAETLQDVRGDWLPAVGAAEVMVHPEAPLVGRSLTNDEFRDGFGLEPMGLLHGAEPPQPAPRSLKLRANDRLMVAGPWAMIDALIEKTHDFVLLAMPGDRRGVPQAAEKFLVALAILGGMVALSVLNIVPVVVAVLLAAIAAILCGTLTPETAYRAVNWSSIVLVAGMLPLADALEGTGGSQAIVEMLFDVVGADSPRVMMAVLFLLTAVIGLVLSNTATAVLLTPIAINAAQALDVSPYPFAITVLMGASAAFSTPVSTPVVTLVVAPGGYSFGDFLRIGVPLTILIGIVTVAMTPLVFPF
ncbi:anion permease [Zavarzinia compransoris]|uniref:SLC13 family permease n=1 Tax=Zavarzinia marina TaxID=2911065 RepID=UPI001F1F78DA|nr:SLC13 family permease [Zavarzinia marina]MCF4166396.1 anion permease [Zavarzinia marina]